MTNNGNFLGFWVRSRHDFINTMSSFGDGVSDITEEVELLETGFSTEEFINLVGDAGSSLDSSGNGVSGLLGLV